MTRLHHVQVCCPEGGEDAARELYVDGLGLTEVAKPDSLAGRGGCWFRGEGYELHIGVDEAFRPAAKGHPAFTVDEIDIAAARLTALGFEVRWDGDFPGYRRFYTADRHGNRVEILQPVGPSEDRPDRGPD